MKNKFQGKRGPDFVDVDLDSKKNLTPEQEQLERYTFLVRSANDGFSSPLNEYQKTICNLMMAMHQTCVDSAVKQVIAENGYKKYDDNMVDTYQEQLTQQINDDMCKAEAKVRKGKAWLDIEGVDSPLERKLKTFDYGSSKNPKDWS